MIQDLESFEHKDYKRDLNAFHILPPQIQLSDAVLGFGWIKKISVEILLLPNLTLKLQLHSLHCSFGFIGNSPFPQRDASEIFWHFILVLHVSWKVHFRSEDQAFYWSIYDSCWQDQVSVRALRHDSRVGGFQIPGVCLQAFPSSLPHPVPAYSGHFSRGLCCAVFDSRNSTETLATQATKNCTLLLSPNNPTDITLLLTKTTAARSSQEAVMTSHCS